MKIKIDGIELNYIDEGEGENVLILHGWGASIETVRPIINILNGKFRVVAVDLPGFGYSQMPKESINSIEYALIVKKFIKELGLSDLILIGHSHGGRIAIIIASNWREMVDKLILIDAAGIIPKRRIRYYCNIVKFKIVKKIYMLFSKDKEKREKFYKRYGSDDYKGTTNEIMRNTFVKVVNDNIEPYLNNINAETLLVWGEEDKATPLYMGKKINKKIKDSGLVILENAGHYSYLDKPYEFKLVIDSFLK